MQRPIGPAPSGLSRRTALGSVAALTAGLGLGSQRNRATAQEATDLSGHPLTGTWLAMANPPLPDDPQIPVPSLFAADGTVLLGFPATQRGPEGVQFTSSYVGTWEPDDERTGHFTAVQLISAADGAFLGTVTVDGYPQVSDDGLSFTDDGSQVIVTLRDATGAIVNQIVPTVQPAGRPVTAVRMGVGSPGFPQGTPAATPMP
ncbi:MAG: hypothetical protein ACRDJC_03045 [Thermomicrobiales bacterium]